MAWIEAHQSLSRHRKTLRAAALLKIKRQTLVGHIFDLWWWCVDNIGPDGNMGDITDEEIAAAADWDGKAAEFVRALMAAGGEGKPGFIEERDGSRWLHDWHDYAGKLLERRAADLGRKREVRTKSGGIPQDVRRNSVGQSAGHPMEVRTDGVRTVPNSTVHNQAKHDDDEGKEGD